VRYLRWAGWAFLVLFLFSCLSYLAVWSYVVS